MRLRHRVAAFVLTAVVVGGGCGAPGSGRLPPPAVASAIDDARVPAAVEARTAALAAADYLRRAVRDDGRFVYRLDVVSGAALDGYNLVRHAGTAHAMLEAWALAPDDALLAAARRALDHLDQEAAPWPLGAAAGAAGAAFVADGDTIKLGGVALAALAMTTHEQVTGDRRYRARAQALGQYLLASLGVDGAFIHQRAKRDGAILGFQSAYYPGEAVLALVRLHALDGDAAWLDAAARAAHYLADVRDRGVADAELPHDHWLLYGLADLDRVRPDAALRAHGLRIARIIARAQQGARDAQPGAWDARGRSTPAATRLEGLLAALALLRADASDVDTAADRALFSGAIHRGIGFLLRTQLTAARARAGGLGDRGVGAFTESLDSGEARIDYSQHALSALLAYAKARDAGVL